MPPDKYAAVWLSYSSISDFLRCPRTYFLKNVYKDSKTGRKIMLMSPPLALGQAVHEVVESLSVLPVEQRFIQPLVEKFETTWKKVSGKKLYSSPGDVTLAGSSSWNGVTKIFGLWSTAVFNKFPVRNSGNGSVCLCHGSKYYGWKQLPCRI